MGALIAASASPGYPAEIALVISDRRDASGLRLAEERGIPTIILDRQSFPSKPAFESALDEALRQASIDLVCLAGFMRVLSPGFVEAWLGRLLNIHPSLLPAFPGLQTHERALAEGVKIHGATVHFVRAEVDKGPVIAQGAVPVLAEDTAATLAARVLAVEHRIYPLALALVASGAPSVLDKRVRVDDGPAGPNDLLLWPRPA
jgi:phosphoribosylglycinamide formyltransferase-1